MGALLGLIPTKDMVVGALVVGLAILGWHFYDKYESAVNYAVTVKAESVVALKAANDQIAKDKADYLTQSTQDKANYENSLASITAQHSADLSGLRQLATTLSKNSTVLPSPPGFSTAPIAGLPGRMANVFVDAGVCADVINDLRQTRAALALAYADRDSLTGK
ncbi:MAG: hypothetical protein ACHP8B_14120 [Terriglobales bacterium]